MRVLRVLEACRLSLLTQRRAQGPRGAADARTAHEEARPDGTS
jgi:hypothetical protein